MRSDEMTVLEPELITEDTGKSVRLYAYSCAISGKERSAWPSAEDKAKNGPGVTGLLEELQKTVLGV